MLNVIQTNWYTCDKHLMLKCEVSSWTQTTAAHQMHRKNLTAPWEWHYHYVPYTRCSPCGVWCPGLQQVIHWFIVQTGAFSHKICTIRIFSSESAVVIGESLQSAVFFRVWTSNKRFANHLWGSCVCMCVCVSVCTYDMEIWTPSPSTYTCTMMCRWMQHYVRIEEMVEKITEMNLEPERKTEQMSSTSPWPGEVLHFIR